VPDSYNHYQPRPDVAGANALALELSPYGQGQDEVLVQPVQGLAPELSYATTAYPEPTKADVVPKTGRATEWVVGVRRLGGWTGHQVLAGMQRLQTVRTPQAETHASTAEQPGRDGLSRAILANYPLPPIPRGTDRQGMSYDRVSWLPTERFGGGDNGTLLANEQPQERRFGGRLLPTYAVMAGALAIGGAVALAIVNKDPAAIAHGIIQAGHGLNQAPLSGHGAGVLPSGRVPSIEGALGRAPRNGVDRIMQALQRARGGDTNPSSETLWGQLRGLGVAHPGSFLTRTAERLHIPYQWHGSGKDAWFSLQEHGKIISSTKQVMRLLFGQRQLGS